MGYSEKMKYFFMVISKIICTFVVRYILLFFYKCKVIRIIFGLKEATGNCISVVSDIGPCSRVER